MPLGDDDVGIFPARFHENFVHRTNRLRILPDHRIEAPLPLDHVPLQSADKPDVVRRLDEDLDIHQVAQLLLAKEEDPLEDDHLRRVLQHSRLYPGIGGEIVHRNLHRPAGDQLPQMANQQVGFQCVGMVKIHLFPFGEREMAAILVIGIVFDHQDIRVPDLLDNGVGDFYLLGRPIRAARGFYFEFAL